MTLTKADFLAFAEKMYTDPTVDFRFAPELDNQECFNKIIVSLSDPCMLMATMQGPQLAFYSAFATGVLWGIAYKEWIEEKRQLEDLSKL